MTELAPSPLVRAQAWDAVYMEKNSSWKFALPKGWRAEAHALAEWASKQTNPVEVLENNSVSTPQIGSLSQGIKRELHQGTGVAWIRGVTDLDHQVLNLFFLKLSLALGNTIDTYGRLYGVQNAGMDYKTEPIPISQTNEATSVHTDSSQKLIQPRIVGLCCLTPAVSGGISKVVSAAQVHERVRASSPEDLLLLYKSYIRDLVAPDSKKNVEHLLGNQFPIFSYINSKLSIRYMRYWIEKGHERVGKVLSKDVCQSLDLLDQELNNKENVVSFSMKSGDLLFLDNTRVLHDREKFTDTLSQRRKFTRVWIE
ncbi:TauD/TfdA family dioxygenase [Microbulbifer sp. PAAF003]|uniref:TauD/TfdA family dioxygenase n=1 Tax=Microbulbifer sp. PAAF003 TaxID=3243375 RepID=UPI00403A1169